MYKEDTIAAIATPAGEGGVAIVRVSGPDAERIAAVLFTRTQEKNGKLRSHTLYHGTIRDPGNRQVVDNVLLTIMRKPRSYTGEDVVEVHCHGGVFLVRRILGLILTQGARHAELEEAGGSADGHDHGAHGASSRRVAGIIGIDRGDRQQQAQAPAFGVEMQRVLTAHVVGYATQARSRAGLERAMNAYLTASNSQLATVLDTALDRLKGGTIHGNDVLLTLNLRAQRAAMAAHRSQIGEDSFFLNLPEDLGKRFFGVEQFVRHGLDGDGPPSGIGLETDLFAGLRPRGAAAVGR